MRTQIKRTILILIPFVFFFVTVFSQNNETGTGKAARLYREGTALFDAGNYGSAIRIFEELQSEGNGILSPASAYYLAASRLELGNPNGEAELKKFVQDQPESPLIN